MGRSSIQALIHTNTNHRVGVVFIVYSIDPKCNLLNPEKRNETPRVFDVFFLFFVQKQKARLDSHHGKLAKTVVLTGDYYKLWQRPMQSELDCPLCSSLFISLYIPNILSCCKQYTIATIDGILACLKVVLGVCCVCMCIDIYIYYIIAVP